MQSQVESLLASGRGGQAMALLSAAIDRDPQPELFALRAQLTMTTAEAAPGSDFREQLEWLTAPAGQQSVAIGRERALADVDSALARQDRAEWRLLRGDLLLEGGRWDEAAAEFAAVLNRVATLPAAEAREAAERAQIGLELARRASDGPEQVLEVWQDAASALSEHDADSELASRVAEARDVIAELDARAEQARAELDPVDERAGQVARTLARLHADVPERYGPFDARDLDRGGRRFYDRALKALRREGYELCADVEPLRNTEQSGTRTLVRVVLSPDRLTAAACWRLETAQRACEAIELESALADGSFLRTNDLGTTNPFEQPPQILQLSLPAGTDAATLVATHRQRLAGAAAPALELRDFAAVAEMQERQRVVKREFVRSRGWVTEAELRGMLGASYDELADAVRAELARLLG